MNFIQKLKTQKNILNKIELIFAFIFITIGKLLDVLVGKGVAIEVSTVLLLLFIILLIIFFRQHTYGSDKPLLAAFSIYYKSVTYITMIYITCNLPGRIYIEATAMISMLLYAILSYFFGKKYNEMLNAYLYFLLIGLVLY